MTALDRVRPFRHQQGSDLPSSIQGPAATGMPRLQIPPRQAPHPAVLGRPPWIDLCRPHSPRFADLHLPDTILSTVHCFLYHWNSTTEFPPPISIIPYIFATVYSLRLSQPTIALPTPPHNFTVSTSNVCTCFRPRAVLVSRACWSIDLQVALDGSEPPAATPQSTTHIKCADPTTLKRHASLTCSWCSTSH